MKERVCEYCGNYYIPTGRNQKFCVYCKYEAKLRYARFKDRESRGFLHNAQPKGKDSPFYKNGIKGYPLKAKIDGAKCEICGSIKNLVVHHRDGNRQNNEDTNLQVLCKKCHQKEHHAVTYLLCDCDGNVLHALVSKESVLKFLNSLGYFPKDTSGIRRAIRNKTKIYGFYWQRVLKA